MPVEWVVAGLVAVISALSGAVTLLWRKHLADDARRDVEIEAWKAIAVSSSGSVGELVPAVTKLTTAVEVEHRVAAEGRADDRSFRDEWRRVVGELGDLIRDLVRTIGARRRT